MCRKTPNCFLFIKISFCLCTKSNFAKSFPLFPIYQKHQQNQASKRISLSQNFNTSFPETFLRLGDSFPQRVGIVNKSHTVFKETHDFILCPIVLQDEIYSVCLKSAYSTLGNCSVCF